MAEATALTRAGRLAEATALIQRTLAGEGPVRVVPGEIVVDEERLRDDGPTEARPPDPDASTGREHATATGPAGTEGNLVDLGRHPDPAGSRRGTAREPARHRPPPGHGGLPVRQRGTAGPVARAARPGRRRRADPSPAVRLPASPGLVDLGWARPREPARPPRRPAHRARAGGSGVPGKDAPGKDAAGRPSRRGRRPAVHAVRPHHRHGSAPARRDAARRHADRRRLRRRHPDERARRGARSARRLPRAGHLRQPDAVLELVQARRPAPRQRRARRSWPGSSTRSPASTRSTATACTSPVSPRARRWPPCWGRRTRTCSRRWACTRGCRTAARRTSRPPTRPCAAPRGPARSPGRCR